SRLASPDMTAKDWLRLPPHGQPEEPHGIRLHQEDILLRQAGGRGAAGRGAGSATDAGADFSAGYGRTSGKRAAAGIPPPAGGYPGAAGETGRSSAGTRDAGGRIRNAGVAGAGACRAAVS